MPDIAHQFGSDLVVSATGDLLTADGSTWTTQRVLRRLFTNPGDYIWEPLYGAGLPKMVGKVMNPGQIEAIVLQQMRLEQGVAQNPPPTVAVTNDALGHVWVSIVYTDAVTNVPVPLTFPLG